MSELETEYRGYTIRYVENQDVWRCHVLDMDGETLTQLKNKIGRYLAKVAKTAEVIPAFYAAYSERFEPCFIVSLSAKKNYRGEDQVWTYSEREERWRGGTRTVKDRKQHAATDIILDTPENRTLIADAERLIRLAKAAKDQATAAVKSIPRVDTTTLKADDGEGE